MSRRHLLWSVAGLSEPDARACFWDLMEADGRASAQDFAAALAAGAQFTIAGLHVRGSTSGNFSAILR